MKKEAQVETANAKPQPTATNPKKSTSPVSYLINHVLSPYFSFLGHTHYNDVSVEDSERYIRSDKHPLAILHKKTQVHYPQNKLTGQRPHVGAYVNPMQLLGDRIEKQAVPNRILGDSQLYDCLLNYRLVTCQKIVRALDKSRYIHVSAFNNYPCIEVFIKNTSPMFKKLTDAAKEDWGNVLISLLVAITNYSAIKSGIPIELIRRSSFGFLTPTVATTGDSIRLNVGIIPDEYTNLLISNLQMLDNALQFITENPTRYPIPKDLVFNTKEYRDYLENEKRPIQNATNVIEVLCAKAEKKRVGKTTIQNMMRTRFVRQKITLDTFNSLLKRDKIDHVAAADAFMSAITSVLQKMTVRDDTLTCAEARHEPLTSDTSFNQLANKTNIEDKSFWATIENIITRFRSLGITSKDFVEAIDALCKNYNQKSIDMLYYNLEALHESLLNFAIENRQDEGGDGYGSSSEVEGDVETKRLHSKKVIVHNGMRAILSALLGIRALHLEKNPQFQARIFTNNAYYEVEDALKVLPQLHEAVGSMSIVDHASLANVVIFDINACVTNGRPLDINLDITLADKIVIFDATSASTAQCKDYLKKIVKSSRNFQLTVFVSSGLKNEQCGADKNHYGTVRLFGTDKKEIENLYLKIKAVEPPLQSPVAHKYRRLYKQAGATLVNSAFFAPAPKQPEPAQPQDTRAAQASSPST